MDIEHTAEIAAPPETVWALTVDVERWPALLPAMTSVERGEPGPMRVGATARVKQPGQGLRTWTVTECDEAKRFVWETRGAGLRMVATHDLEPTATGCRNTLGIHLSGPMGAVLGRLAGRRIAATIAEENAIFTREAERG
jgi:carbon monoxide dehydrogenase subunit G